ncbi:hypothetical protein ACFXG4_17850 [Nocardia sp. NPDC059246]|uniref:hypothetical protein n=1 Tax=unclassified Nocardia TaxID=2637762 RepID=UPI0036D1511C
MLIARKAISRTNGQDRTTGFVLRETARSLLVALQTAPPSNGPFLLKIPTVDDPHDRPGRPPYELNAWLNTARIHYGIDQHDERGEGILFPPARPADNIIEQFDLTTDEDLRNWFLHGNAVFRSRVWKDTSPGPSHHREPGTRGELLEVDREFLRRVLQDLDVALVLRVAIRRDLDRPIYNRKEDDDELGWIEWSAKIYLVDPTGQWFEY